MTTDSIATLQRYVIHSQQYLENALIALQHGEAGKAGELLWGSVAQALNAVAGYTNKSVRTHRELKNFAIQLGRDLNDRTIENDFVVAESLHYNFYVVEREPQDIEIIVPVVQELVSKLLNLIPPEATRQAITP
jgi:hypothetical protein